MILKRKFVLLETLPVIIIPLFALFVRWLYPDNMDAQHYYGFANCIKDGLLPYKDFSMLQTPLSMYYLSVFFHFSDSLRVIILATWLLEAGNAVIAYQILMKLKASPWKAKLAVSLWMMLQVLSQSAPYSSMGILFWLLCMYCYFCYREKQSNRVLILTGLFAVCSFFSKQNLGAYCVASVGICYLLFLIREKKSEKDYIKCISVLCVSYLIFMAAGLGIMALLGNLKEFFEFCVFGIAEFYTKIDISIPIIAAICGLYILLGCLTKQPELTIFGVFAMLLAYPVFNDNHYMASFICLFMMLATADIKKKHLAIAGFCTVMYSLHLGIEHCKPYISKEGITINTYTADYFPKRFAGELYDYLSDKDINAYHIIDILSGYYNICFDRYDKYYDCFLYGNLGQKTPIEIVQETIQQESTCLFIIWNDTEKTVIEGMEKQFPFEAVQYVKEHCEYIEGIYNADGEETYSVYAVEKE